MKKTEDEKKTEDGDGGGKRKDMGYGIWDMEGERGKGVRWRGRLRAGPRAGPRVTTLSRVTTLLPSPPPIPLPSLLSPPLLPRAPGGYIEPSDYIALHYSLGPWVATLSRVAT